MLSQFGCVRCMSTLSSKDLQTAAMHSFIHSKMILTIHLLMSYATLSYLPICAKTRSSDNSALSYFYTKSLLQRVAGHFPQTYDRDKNVLSFNGH